MWLLCERRNNEAYKDALAGDPISAFGGVLISNSNVDLETAKDINNLFFEVIIGPSYSNEAIKLLKRKKEQNNFNTKRNKLPKENIRSCLNGVLCRIKILKQIKKLI